MEKTFRSIEEQVQLLEGRGARCDARTPDILLREGYYAVVNGYGKAFIDKEATARAGDDRFVRGTTFADMHRLFRFDRDLRASTFRAIMSVECTLRSVLAHTFCEHHRAPEAYLDRSSYTKAKGYLRGQGAYAGDLEWMINTLQHHARGHAVAERGAYEAPDSDKVAEDVRVAWYRENYDYVPLWVLFSDLTFGNLRYFYALMRHDEQEEVCDRMAQVCGLTSAGKVLWPRAMMRDLETLSDLRNDCAHVERIYDGRFGDKRLTYPQVLDVLAAFLAEDDEGQLYRFVDKLVRKYREMSHPVAQVLTDNGF